MYDGRTPSRKLLKFDAKYFRGILLEFDIAAFVSSHFASGGVTCLWLLFILDQTAKSNGEDTPYTYDLWDANKMRSCLCNRTRAVDNFFSATSDTYRGPYAFADTDSYGFDCSLGRSA